MHDVCSAIFDKVVSNCWSPLMFGQINRRDLWHSENELNAILYSSLRSFGKEDLADRYDHA